MLHQANRALQKLKRKHLINRGILREIQIGSRRPGPLPPQPPQPPQPPHPPHAAGQRGTDNVNISSYGSGTTINIIKQSGGRNNCSESFIREYENHNHHNNHMNMDELSSSDNDSQNRQSDESKFSEFEEERGV